MVRRAAAVTLLVAGMAVAAGPAQGQERPRVHLLATGGTISNTGGGDERRRTGMELVDGVPRIREIAEVSVEQVSNVASGALTHEIWRRLATRIRELQRSAAPPAGYIVTQGTDTMEETAWFLSLTVGGCAPVVVTGAMREATAVGADGPANLLNAVRVAIAPAARGHGTVVLMNDEIFAARDVVKSNTTRLNAFSAPDAGVLGLADPDTVVFHRTPPRPAAANASEAGNDGCSSPRFDLDALRDLPRVDVVYAHVGADSVPVDAAVAAGARGLVLAGVGRGGSTPSMGRALRRATERGVFVAVSSRTGSGRTAAGASRDSLAVLPAGRGASIGAADLNPQKARVLLMLALAAGFDAAKVAALFDTR